MRTDQQTYGGRAPNVITLHSKYLMCCRSVLQNGEQKMLKRIVDDAPDLAVKLMEAFMKQGVPKEAQNG